MTEQQIRHIGNPVLTPDEADWGGKGANLMELAQFTDVPPGFVVNADAYDDFMQNDEIQGLEWIDDDGDVDMAWIQRSVGRGEIDLEEIEQTTQDVFMNSNLPEQYREPVNQAVQRYEPGFFARSSAVNEDGDENSGAGRLESEGPFETPEEVRNGIVEVYSSAFDEKAIGYLIENDMDGFGGVAVVVQEAIDPAFGGVIYSSDPNGDPSNVYMELNHDPADVVDDDVRDIIEVAEDDIPTGRNEGGVFQYKNNKGDGEALPTKEQVMELAGTAVDIESEYDSPTDIEAAYDTEGNLWILQGRPITVDGYDEPEFDIPGEIDPPTGQKVAETGVVRNSGILEAPAVVVDEADPSGPYEAEGTLRDYDSQFSDGYVVVTPCMNEEIENRTGNAEGLVASGGGKTSHASTVADENGLLYMGALESKPEENLEHGDPLYMAVNGHEGELYMGESQ